MLSHHRNKVVDEKVVKIETSVQFTRNGAPSNIQKYYCLNYGVKQNRAT